MLKTVPGPAVPPLLVMPYRVEPDRVGEPNGDGGHQAREGVGHGGSGPGVGAGPSVGGGPRAGTCRPGGGLLGVSAGRHPACIFLRSYVASAPGTNAPFSFWILYSI